VTGLAMSKIDDGRAVSETYSATNDIPVSCQYSLTTFELPAAAHIFVDMKASWC